MYERVSLHLSSSLVLNGFSMSKPRRRVEFASSISMRRVIGSVLILDLVDERNLGFYPAVFLKGMSSSGWKRRDGRVAMAAGFVRAVLVGELLLEPVSHEKGDTEVGAS